MSFRKSVNPKIFNGERDLLREIWANIFGCHGKGIHVTNGTWPIYISELIDYATIGNRIDLFLSSHLLFLHLPLPQFKFSEKENKNESSSHCPERGITDFCCRLLPYSFNMVSQLSVANWLWLGWGRNHGTGQLLSTRLLDIECFHGLS